MLISNTNSVSLKIKRVGPKARVKREIMNTGFQTDWLSCGFWAVLTALGAIFDLSELYSAYAGDECGISKEVEGIAKSQPEKANIIQPQTGVQAEVTQVPLFATTPNAQAAVVTVDHTSLKEFMATMKYPWDILKDPNANQFRHDMLFCLNPEEWLNEEIINCYLWLCGQAQSSKRYHIVNTGITKQIDTQRPSQPFRPSAEKRKLWITKKVDYFLQFNFNQCGVEFPDEWTENREAYTNTGRIDYLLQSNKFDCGLFYYLFRTGVPRWTRAIQKDIKFHINGA
ncbi:hypothetical protein M422DRAFT_247966 [Sphaerobolus stellatus SS14]|nr:hypothetical protein M422DRAFT_247966 [Sphaerobolus stellatus SS14]